ncbi:EAL domain-containing protein [Marinimicrobium agarilyticum]|uniref:EAL domain-containing protein n=1 Tax=Marinimicrobium agarilyticum TaxID=306546 RepID=UPI0003FC316D|nr:EAL domain-containing protein [Marinimicrobium agarilyticum]
MSKRSVKIMTVDDDEFTRRLISQLLTNHGYVMIKEVVGGVAALELLKKLKTKPDVIILDLKMPEMDGIELVRHLAELKFPGQVILLSGEDERLLRAAQNLVRAHNIPVLGYLTKPVDEQKLAQLMEKLLQQSPVALEREGEPFTVDELAQAIAENQLVNEYQPVVTLSDGELASVEVLVRWQHPTKGRIMPDQFIALAEEEGLIDALTRWVISEALAQSKRWLEEEVHCALSINLSMENLDQLDFTDWLAQLVEEANLQPWDLILEVTESRAMRRPKIVLDNLTRLRLKGFKLAVDDFGTGHASLAQVRDIPFDQFKLDRTFVHGASHDRGIRVMFESALGLAKELGLEITAEGVEDEEDWQFLLRQDCHKAQGYFIARPMAADKVSGWLTQWRNETRKSLFPDLIISGPAEGVETEPSPMSRGVALVVEDNDFQRKVQARILRDEGFEPHMAANGREALALLRELSPSLLLIDIEMPGMSGLELLRRLRGKPAFVRTPVLVISGVNTKTVVRDSMEAGASSFMVKPYSRETLIERIRRAMQPG